MSRKYTEAQQEAMVRLYLEGQMPRAISRAAADGIGDLSPFEIPRKSVEAVVKRGAAKVNRRGPAPLDSEDLTEKAQRLKWRTLTALDRELDRIELAQDGGREAAKRLGMFGQ